MFNARHFGLMAAGSVLCGLSNTATAAPETFTFQIQSGSSALVLGGQFGGNTPNPQSGTTFSVSYSGEIVAEIDRDANTIYFPGTSKLTAGLQPSDVEPDEDSTPFSDAPGNYGREGNVNIFGNPQFGVEAIRGLVLDVETAAIGVPSSYNAGTGQFASGDIGLLVDVGTADFQFGSQASDTDLSGPGFASNSAATPSTLLTSGGIETLTLRLQSGPLFHTVFSANDSSMTFTGTIVATRVVPEPAALSLLALGGLTLLSRRRRRLN